MSIVSRCFSLKSLWKKGLLGCVAAGVGLNLATIPQSAWAVDFIEFGGQTYPISDLSIFAETGQETSLITNFIAIKQPDSSLQEMQEGLNRKIDVDVDRIGDMTVKGLHPKDRKWITETFRGITDQELRDATQAIHDRGQDVTVINFIKSFPVETATNQSVLDELLSTPILNPPEQPKKQPPGIKFWIEGEDKGELGLFSVFDNVQTIDFEQGIPESDELTYSSGGSVELKTLVERDTSKSRSTGGANNQYLSVFYSPLLSSKREIQINSKNALDYFGMHWGTVDAYNFIHFMRDDELIDSFTGRDIVNRFTGNIYVNFLANNSESYFNKIILSSSSPDFETDNHAYRSVPEPTMLLGGLAFGVFYNAAKRKRK